MVTNNTKKIYFIIYFLLIILSLFQSFRILNFISNNKYSNFIEPISDNIILIYPPIFNDSLQPKQRYYLNNIQNFYFSEEQFINITNNDLVSNTTKIPSTQKIKSSTYVMDSKGDEYSIIDNNVEYLTLSISKDIVDVIGTEFYDFKSNLVGEYPKDNTDEVIISTEFQRVYNESHNTNITTGDIIYIDCKNILTNENKSIPLKISGIIEYSTPQIFRSFDSKNRTTIENNSNLFINDSSTTSTEIEQIYQEEFLDTLYFISQINSDISYEEFKKNNSDLIEGILIETNSSSDRNRLISILEKEFPYSKLYYSGSNNKKTSIEILKPYIVHIFKNTIYILSVIMITSYIFFKNDFKKINLHFKSIFLSYILIICSLALIFLGIIILY